MGSRLHWQSNTQTEHVKGSSCNAMKLVPPLRRKPEQPCIAVRQVQFTQQFMPSSIKAHNHTLGCRRKRLFTSFRSASNHDGINLQYIHTHLCLHYFCAVLLVLEAAMNRNAAMCSGRISRIYSYWITPRTVQNFLFNVCSNSMLGW